MLRKLLIGIFMLSVVSLLPAQDLILTWGEDIASETNILKILGRTENGHYALANRKKEFFIEHFSGPTMRRDFSTPLEFRKENKLKSELANAFYLNGQLSLMTVAYEQSEKTYHIYGYLLDEKGKIAGQRNDIISVKVDKGRRRGEFEIKHSRDKSKLLVMHSAPHRVKGGDWEWKVKMNVMNSELQLIKKMEETITLKDEKDYISISNFYVDDNATVWMAARKIGYSKAEKMEVTKSMTIYQYDPTNGFEVRKIPLDIGNKKASSVALTTDPEGNLVGGGFYSERNSTGLLRYEGLKGSFFFAVDREKSELKNIYLEPFGHEFAEMVLREKAAAKGRLVPNAFIPRNIIPRTDGGAVMVAEYYTHTITTSRSARREVTVHGPLAVVNLNPQGKVEWVKALPKYQVYTKTTPMIGFGGFSRGFSFGFSFWLDLAKDKTVYHSFLLAAREEKLNFIYNDDPKNLEVSHAKDTRPLRGWKGSVPVSVVIDGNGEVTKQILQEKDRSEVVLRSKIYFQEDYGSVLIYGSNRGKDKFGEIVF